MTLLYYLLYFSSKLPIHYLLHKTRSRDKLGIVKGISHTQLGISRSVFIWTTRFLGLVSAVTFILLAFLNAILNPNFLIIGFLVAAGIYFFWYYNWLLDATPPIDRRIINCFRKK